jgi:SPP1 family holin
MKENTKVTPATIARTIVLVLALANQVFALVGMPALGIEDASIYEAVTLVATVATAVWAWWKNNSFTPAAIAGDAAKDSYAAKHVKEGTE